MSAASHFSKFMKPEYSVWCSCQPTICPYPPYSCKIYFNLIGPSMPRSSKQSFIINLLPPCKTFPSPLYIPHALPIACFSVWSPNDSRQYINIMQLLIMQFFFSILLLPASLAQTILTAQYTVLDKQHIKKGQVVSVHAVRTHTDSTDIAQVFCNLNTWHRWVVNFNAMATLFLEK